VPILGWAQVLKNGNINDADLQKGIDVIDRNARVQAQLIEDLLDMSRIISGKVRIDAQPIAPISAVEAAIETVTPGADAKGVRVDKLLDPAAGPITGDPARLQQIVWNLLSNAIKVHAQGRAGSSHTRKSGQLSADQLLPTPAPASIVPSFRTYSSASNKLTRQRRGTTAGSVSDYRS
jgi:K+-sensing histidine kinase KdpD